MVTELGDFHHPDRLCGRQYEQEKKEVLRAVKDGMEPKDACMMIYGITPQTWYNWVKWTEDDIRAGFNAEESRLIKLMTEMASHRLGLRHKLEKKANRMALKEDNVEMLKFLLERKHGYEKKTKKDVDVGVKEDAPIKFEFVDMTPTDNED